MATLPSSLSEEDIEALLVDLPDRPIPTYAHLPYLNFLHNHLVPNTPFVLSRDATAIWPSRSAWATCRDSGEPGPSQPNLTSLRQYGHHIVPVANTIRRQYSEFERTERSLSEVIGMWEGVGDVSEGTGAGMYVKDWHLLAEVESAGGGAGEIYEVPECFREDWLNPAYTPHPRSSTSPALPSSQFDFRFTYLGTRGTFTPLHRDVYASYSWSANIVGRKMWWLFPPDPEILGKLGIGPPDGKGNGRASMVFDVRDLGREVGGIKILQEEGEIIFVPSGWYHQVVNLDFCISINHNFIAPVTLLRVYATLEQAQLKVEESISDVLTMIQSRLGVGTSETNDGAEQEVPAVPAWESEWVEEVQKLLEMDHGWGWKGFWDCIRNNVKSPPASAEHSTPLTMRDKYIRAVLTGYKSRREWIVLSDIRETVAEIEILISH